MKANDLTVLIGTTKGALLIAGGGERADWNVDDYSQIRSLAHAHDTLYARTKPAGLLVSRDSGKTWSRLDGMNDHPSAESWNPGAAGLVLHTIVADPPNADKLWVGISAAGVFATEDGGKSWDRRNRLSDAEACNHHDHPAAPGGGEVGHCVHNMTLAPGSTDLLYRQNHHGVRRCPVCRAGCVRADFAI